jgi:transposase
MKEETMSKLTTIGIDLAKSVFFLVALSHSGQVLWRRKLRRQQLLAFLANQEASVVAMEACGSAHHWAREIEALGHQVQLLPAQRVKAYLGGQKNDFNDAVAIAEASQHGRIRPVRVKTVEQQDDQAFHTLRRSISHERVRISNRLRGLLAEYGVVVARGVGALRRAIPQILEDGDNGLTARLRELVQREYRRLQALDEEMAWYDQALNAQVRADETCTRLLEMPAVGPVVASALKSWMGDGRQFKRGRDASAALGLVPRQHTTGGKQVLLGITKRGDSYVRSLIIHGARAVVARADRKTDSLSRWIQRLKATRGANKAAVALANKLIRVAWVVIARGEQYRPPVTA